MYFSVVTVNQEKKIAMLSLRRKPGERLKIDDDVTITDLGINDYGEVEFGMKRQLI